MGKCQFRPAIANLPVGADVGLRLTHGPFERWKINGSPALYQNAAFTSEFHLLSDSDCLLKGNGFSSQYNLTAFACHVGNTGCFVLSLGGAITKDLAGLPLGLGVGMMELYLTSHSPASGTTLFVIVCLCSCCAFSTALGKKREPTVLAPRYFKTCRRSILLRATLSIIIYVSPCVIKN